MLLTSGLCVVRIAIFRKFSKIIEYFYLDLIQINDCFAEKI